MLTQKTVVNSGIYNLKDSRWQIEREGLITPLSPFDTGIITYFYSNENFNERYRKLRIYSAAFGDKKLCP